MRLTRNERTRHSDGDELGFYFFLIRAPANTSPTFPIGKGFQPCYNVASLWSCQICRVRKSRRQSVTLAFLFPHFPYHQAKNAFFHLHLPVPLCSTTSLSCISEEWRCHANDMFLFLPSEGQFKLSPWRWLCISDAKTCACKYCKWIQCRSGGISFLKTEQWFFFPLLKYKLPCLFKAEVWGVLISTSSLKPFHIQMNVKCY